MKNNAEAEVSDLEKKIQDAITKAHSQNNSSVPNKAILKMTEDMSFNALKPN